MVDQAAARKLLQELSKQNKTCNDCSNPNPQWASISFAVFLCLQCAGTHRGFGVHISFVRSVSMDTWQDDQIKRMQLGGNIPFKEFMQSYTPADQGGYTQGMSPYDTYHCWAATQYREKLDATLADKPWSPSPPPEGFSSPGSTHASPGRPSSAQGLRKSRASTRTATGSTLRSSSASPAPFRPTPQGTPDLGAKTANESYFASLGELNAARPAELPPSQGGRYAGFGNTPPPAAPAQHAAYGLSSAAAPSLTELQRDPMGALGKGWSLFSAAVAGASRVVAENVIQPGVEKVTDPNLQASVKGYVSEAQKRAAIVGSSANQWSKDQFGVDVAESVGGVVDTVKDKIGGGPVRAGYGSLAQDHEETTGLYHDGDDELFTEYNHSRGLDQQYDPHSIADAASTAKVATKKDDWDEWKDF